MVLHLHHESLDNFPQTETSESHVHIAEVEGATQKAIDDLTLEPGISGYLSRLQDTD